MKALTKNTLGFPLMNSLTPLTLLLISILLILTNPALCSTYDFLTIHCILFKKKQFFIFTQEKRNKKTKKNNYLLFFILFILILFLFFIFIPVFTSRWCQGTSTWYSTSVLLSRSYLITCPHLPSHPGLSLYDPIPCSIVFQDVLSDHL